MRLVLDTNVLVSALFWKGNERRLLQLCFEGRHRIVTSPLLLAEAERVLVEKFSYPKDDTAAFLGAVARAAEVVTPRTPLAIVREDPADDRVIECAVEGDAELIVTGDRPLLRLGTFRSIRVVRAAEALREGDR